MRLALQPIFPRDAADVVRPRLVQERQLDALHDSNWPLVVAVTHDINVAAFLAGRGVVASFTEGTWPDYLDAAVVVERPDGNREYGFIRWHKDMEGIDLMDMRYA